MIPIQKIAFTNVIRFSLKSLDKKNQSQGFLAKSILCLDETSLADTSTSKSLFKSKSFQSRSSNPYS